VDKITPMDWSRARRVEFWSGMVEKIAWMMEFRARTMTQFSQLLGLGAWPLGKITSMAVFRVNLVSLARRVFLNRFSDRRPRYFRYENHPWFSPSGPAYRLFKFASKRICAWPKESTQRKGGPDAACSLRSSDSNGVLRRGFPTPA
jgi:hypothetical protein